MKNELLLALLFVILGGCGSGGSSRPPVPDGSTNPPVDASMDAAGSLRITVPAELLIYPGDTVALPVTIEQHDTSAVTVSASGLPMGVIAPPVTVAPLATSATLLLTADSLAAQANVTMTVTATAGALHASATTHVMVAGTSGMIDLSLAGDGTLTIDQTNQQLDSTLGFLENHDFFFSASNQLVHIAADGSVAMSTALPAGYASHKFASLSSNRVGISMANFDVPYLVSLYDSQSSLVSSFANGGTYQEPTTDWALFSSGNQFVLEGRNSFLWHYKVVDATGNVIGSSTQKFFDIFQFGTRSAASSQGDIYICGLNVNKLAIGKIVNGQPDSTFGTNGLAVFSDAAVPTANGMICNITLRPDGGGYVLGNYYGAATRVVLAQFSAAGIFTLIDNNVVTTDVYSDGAALAVDDDGRVVVAASDVMQGVILRYVDGARDQNFGSNGRVNIALRPQMLWVQNGRISAASIEAAPGIQAIHVTRLWQ